MEAPDDYAGRTARCPTCNRKIRVPQPSQASVPVAESAELDRASTSSQIFRMGGRAYELRPRLEGSLIASALVNLLSVGLFVSVGMLAEVYTPWFLAGLVGAGMAVFAALLVVPAWYNIRRSRGRRTGNRLALANLATAGLLVAACLCVGLVAKATEDTAPCDERLRAVHRALRQYASNHEGRFPPRPETLVRRGYLPAAKLTCPEHPGARCGEPTYIPESYRPEVDFGNGEPFPKDLVILIDRALTTIVDESTGKRVRGHYALELGGRVTYVPHARLEEAIEYQRRVIGRILTERELLEDALSGPAEEDGEKGESGGEDGTPDESFDAEPTEPETGEAPSP